MHVAAGLSLPPRLSRRLVHAAGLTHPVNIWRCSQAREAGKPLHLITLGIFGIREF